MSACIAHDRQFQLSSNYLVIAAFDNAVKAALGPNSEVLFGEQCLMRPRVDETCVFITGSGEPPACPVFKPIEQCYVLALRASLFELPQVQRLIVRESAAFCSYRRPAPDDQFRIDSPGCMHPGSPYELILKQEPVICVVLLGAGPEPPPIRVFAVSHGHQVRHPWCNALHPQVPHGS